MTAFIAIIFFQLALATDMDTFEKTYPRNNAFCQIGKTKIEIMVRGNQSHIESEERLWGEHVFTRIGEGPATKLPVTSESGLYRLFEGNPSSCTKVLGTMIEGKFAILFQKNNRPHKSQLVVQYLNSQNYQALETLHTPFLADKAMVKNNSFLVRTHSTSRREIEMGKITIKNKTYLYQDHRFPVWIIIDKNGFYTDLPATYENFTYKSFFKTIDEFKIHTNWNENEKSFTNTKLYVAINHEEKSKCLLLVKEKKSFTGEENWICQ
jgi:hypothetical protein